MKIRGCKVAAVLVGFVVGAVGAAAALPRRSVEAAHNATHTLLTDQVDEIRARMGVAKTRPGVVPGPEIDLQQAREVAYRWLSLGSDEAKQEQFGITRAHLERAELCPEPRGVYRFGLDHCLIDVDPVSGRVIFFKDWEPLYSGLTPDEKSVARARRFLSARVADFEARRFEVRKPEGRRWGNLRLVEVPRPGISLCRPNTIDLFVDPRGGVHGFAMIDRRIEVREPPFVTPAQALEMGRIALDVAVPADAIVTTRGEAELFVELDPANVPRAVYELDYRVETGRTYTCLCGRPSRDLLGVVLTIDASTGLVVRMD
jgi:hypothetical protein